MQSADVIFKLIRIALGWESEYTLPDNINWEEVFRIASEQGVFAIIIDGYDILISHNPKAKNTLFANEEIKKTVFSQISFAEFNYCRHLAAITELNEVICGRGIPILLLKGFACGQFYPNPRHRPCGDIDIYPGDRFEECNQALMDNGIEVDKDYYYRHSASTIKDVTIENHRVLGDLRGPQRQTKDFEALLKSEAIKSLKRGKYITLEGEELKGAVLPSADFNALFLPWHVSAHFALERVTLRQLLDWALFLDKEGQLIDVELFRRAKKQYTFGYSKFADILTALALKYLSLPVGKIPLPIIQDAINTDDSLITKVYNYIFEGQPILPDNNIWRIRFNNFKRIWRERWKYKEIYGVSTLAYMYYKAAGAIFNVGSD